MTDVPKQWRAYSCDDYYSSSLAEDGYWDESAQLWVIEPAERVVEDESGFLQIGRPGVDGIGFGYRKTHPGLWAYYPMEREFQYLAPTIRQLLDGWLSGEILI